jgi:hypothetical protein
MNINLWELWHDFKALLKHKSIHYMQYHRKQKT